MFENLVLYFFYILITAYFVVIVISYAYVLKADDMPELKFYLLILLLASIPVFSMFLMFENLVVLGAISLFSVFWLILLWRIIYNYKKKEGPKS